MWDVPVLWDYFATQSYRRGRSVRYPVTQVRRGKTRKAFIKLFGGKP